MQCIIFYLSVIILSALFSYECSHIGIIEYIPGVPKKNHALFDLM